MSNRTIASPRAKAATGSDAQSRARASIPVPEPGLTPKEMIARAIALRPKLRAQQDANDERGTYSEELHQDFLKAGFYRCTQPRMFGGYEFDLATFYKVMVEIARGHPGVGWCLGLGASHAFEVASHWPEQAQAELFGPDGHFIAPHRAPPLGTLTPVDGGYIMNGTWDYCSGVPYATHFIGGAFIKREGQPPVHAHAVVAKGNYTILDDWGGDRVLGMRASGSNSVRVENVFVPARVCMAIPCISAGSLGRSMRRSSCRSSVPPARPSMSTKRSSRRGRRSPSRRSFATNTPTSNAPMVRRLRSPTPRKP